MDEGRRVQVGQWLRQRRDELGVTRDRLAKVLEIDPTSVTNAETGKRVPRFKTPWEDALRLVRGSLARAYLDGTPLQPLAEEAADHVPLSSHTRMIATPSGAEVSVTVVATARPSWMDDLTDDELLLLLRDEVRSGSVDRPQAEK